MDLRAIALGLFFVAAWSSAFTSARLVVADAPPFLALSVRFLLSGMIGIGIGMALGQSLRLTRAQWGGVVVFGICQNALYLGLNFEAMQTVEASVAVVIASLLPLIVAALGRIFLGDRLPLLGVVGLVVGFLGVLVMMSARITGGGDPFGMLLCLLGVVALSVATLLVRNLSGGGNLWIIVGMQMLVGAVALFPVSLAFETWTVNWTLSLAGGFLYVLFVSGIAATMVWFVLVARVGATRAASFHFLNPFFGVAAAALVLGERVQPRDIAGVAIVSIGILLVQLARRPLAPTVPE